MVLSHYMLKIKSKRVKIDRCGSKNRTFGTISKLQRVNFSFVSVFKKKNPQGHNASSFQSFASFQFGTLIGELPRMEFDGEDGRGRRWIEQEEGRER